MRRSPQLLMFGRAWGLREVIDTVERENPIFVDLGASLVIIIEGAVPGDAHPVAVATVVVVVSDTHLD